MSRLSAIPGTASAEFGLACSVWQRRWLLSGHLLVPCLLLLARPPWPLLVLICVLLSLHGYWQWQRLVQRSGWRLMVDNGRLCLDQGQGDSVPAVGRVAYLSSWLLVFHLTLPSGVRTLALWRDGFPPQAWRRLQLLARELLRERGMITLDR